MKGDVSENDFIMLSNEVVKSISLCLCLSLVRVIVIHQSCHKEGQLCLHMPSTEFAHAHLKVNMVALYTKPFLG